MQGTSSPHIVQTFNCADFVKFLMMFPVKLNKLNDNDLFKDRGKMQNSRLDGNYASKDVSRI